MRAREVRRLAYRFSKEHVAGVFFQPLEFLKDAPRANEEAVRYFDEAGIAVVLLDYDIAPPPARSGYDLVFLCQSLMVDAVYDRLQIISRGS